jgi:hypothetical protein
MDLSGLPSPMQRLIFYVLTNVINPVFLYSYKARSLSLYIFASLFSPMILHESLDLAVQGLHATGEILMPPFNGRKSQIHAADAKSWTKQSITRTTEMGSE